MLSIETHFGHLETVRLLCDADADKGDAKKDGATPLFMLFISSQCGRFELAGLLCGTDGSNHEAMKDGATSRFMLSLHPNADSYKLRCCCATLAQTMA